MDKLVYKLAIEFDYLDAALSSHVDECRNYIRGFDYKREQLTGYSVVYRIAVDGVDVGEIALHSESKRKDTSVEVTGLENEPETRQWAILREIVIEGWHQEMVKFKMLDNLPVINYDTNENNIPQQP